MTIYFAYHYLEDLDKIRMNFLLIFFFFAMLHLNAHESTQNIL